MLVNIYEWLTVYFLKLSGFIDPGHTAACVIDVMLVYARYV